MLFRNPFRAWIRYSRLGSLPLSGVRVLEMGQLIAGPFGGQLLGYLLDASNFHSS